MTIESTKADIDATQPSPTNKNNVVKTKAKVFSSFLTGLAGSVATASLVFTSTSFFDQSKLDIFGEKAAERARLELNGQLISSIVHLQRDVADLKRLQSVLAENPGKDKPGLQISALRRQVESITKRQEKIEEAIQTNPEKALSLPLLRKDIDSIRDNGAQSIAAIKASVDQVYDLTKWLLGSLAVGIISLAIANFVQRKTD